MIAAKPAAAGAIGALYKVVVMPDGTLDEAATGVAR